MTESNIKQYSIKEILEASAKLVIKKKTLIERISTLNKKTEDTFVDDNTFIHQNSSYEEPSIGLFIVLGMILTLIFLYIIQIMIPSAKDISGILCIIIGFGVTAIIYKLIEKNRKTEALTHAQNMLKEYKRKHESFLKSIEKEKKELLECKQDISLVNQALADLSKLGGIAEEYWEDAYKLWYYIDIGRADTLGQAINLLEAEKRHEELLLIGIQTNQMIGQQMNQMQKRMDEFERKQIDLALQMEYISFRNEINSDLAFVALLLAESK